ncbi:uncharacterized protein I206_100891 [Kwoniella pini CBS 10737]|uniref:Bacteriophytochrome histidine kinase n=1 Tax=Kwoniella pini CBS 10737 TaxID=1296096 RepID=A0A1B9ICH2_9TREE|nr:uncharacterized protein I206_00435 [Kwoniella pini CBS 10737]OCF53134.1 hypothetical protein I206_00435 [Kwoniella pini CBS 10737]
MSPQDEQPRQSAQTPQAAQPPQAAPTIAPPTRPTPTTTPQGSSESVPSNKSSNRSSHPGSVTMPARPVYAPGQFTTGHAQKPISPGHAPGHPNRKTTTPTSEAPRHSPSISPSVMGSTGPLSPSSTYGGNSFVFPMRSVFQGLNSSDGQQGESSTGLNRTISRSSDTRTPSSRHDPNRRFSQSMLTGDGDAGIQSIAQLLQQQDDRENDKPKDKVKGSVTFSGHRSDRMSKGLSTPPTPSTTNTFPFSDFSTLQKDQNSGPSSRRTSAEEVHHTERPDLTHGGSSGTVKHFNEDPPVSNPSADASGSGLPDKSRPPVGVPQGAPATVNFKDYPADQDNAGETTDFSAPTKEERPPPELKQPKPIHPTADTLDQLTRKKTSSASGSKTSVEVDESGIQALVNDFSGIVRLGEAGSFTTGTGGNGTRGGSGTGTRSSAGISAGSKAAGGKGGPSGPTTAARLAQQQRQQGPNTTRDTVRDFINSQARTVNMDDPNAPTPTPMDEESVAHEPATSENLTGPTPAEEIQWAEDKEEASAPASSEQAIASGDEKDEFTATSSEAGSEPIITFRFEHVSDNDGHHVVVGREGKLRRCEDEPITTPGAVQGFGVLLVLEEDYESGALAVRQVSENATELLGLSPKYLFALDCFTRILTIDQEDVLRDNLEYLPIAEGGKGSVEEEGPSVFLLSGYGEPGSDDSEEEEGSATSGGSVNGRRREWTCWAAAHRPKINSTEKKDENGISIPLPDLIILEFELERDEYNPLIQPFESPSIDSTTGSDTPESGRGSFTGASLGSVGSTGGAGSGGSSVTVGSTTVPGRHQGSEGSTVMTAGGNSSTPNTSQHASTSHPSSMLPPGSKPMGLDGLEFEVPIERIIESTTNHAKPLRALERMRRTGQHGGSSVDSGSGSRNTRGARRPRRRPPAGTTGTMDVFAVLGQINDQLGASPDLETFLKITVGVIQDLCRFHRVLIYQFDETMNGQVVSELVEWGKTTDLYKGLNFPAADIPAQARELYKINKVRLLYDRSQTTARMVLRSKEDLDTPLDMTHCYLRAMSPIHIKYLANMHVRSSMSVSIMAFGQLWGLIACHSYGHHGMRVSFPVRQMMRILSDSISRNIERLSYAQRLHTRKLISTIPTQAHPTGYIVSNADDLLQIFDAESGLLVIGDGCKLLGQNDQGQAMLAIAEYLRVMRYDACKASNHIQRDFPDLVLPRAQDTIAGLLYVPLTAKAGQDFIVFLRKGQAREVQWAGKPYKDDRAGDSASLEPRKSFKTWSEIVTGRSRAWTDDQLQSAGVLALIYGKFIQVWREKQSAMASNQLTAILLSNTSHAVRTPLSQIINTLELALSGNIDADVRNMLENSHQASRALLFHVHDLLDLTRIETGNEQSFNDPFDIRQSISDAIRLYQTESSRRNLEFRVIMADNLPQYVIGDSRKIKTVISNLVANSVKFTEKGFVEVYCGLQQPSSSDGAASSKHAQQEIMRGGHVPIEIVISDSGCGIATDKLEAMFVTLEGADELKGSSSNGLGLGLAVVARIVEQLEGQLRAESEVGVGSRFFFTLPMLVHHGRPSSKSSKESAANGNDNHNNNNQSLAIRTRTGSSGSNSVASLRSGLSEVDSFVNDFGNSHMLSQPVPADDQRIKDAEYRMSRPGTFPVTDSSWPVKPSRMDPDSDQSVHTDASPTHGRSPDFVQPPRLENTRRISYRPNKEQGGHARHQSHSSINKTRKDSSSSAQSVIDSERRESASTDQPKRSTKTADGRSTLRVMVVEDDMINSQILQKRLKMDKHTVKAVTNGQEAVTALQADWDYDVVLMDIQMPIMDGRQAAREIRKLEAKLESQRDIEPLRVDGRIPIFAVSASLYESDRHNLAEHFDGWLLKPLDFARVRTLLAALEDPAKRSAEVYEQGHWEKGGYLRAAPSPSSSPDTK